MNGSRETLVDYHKSEFKRYWMPDSTGKDCYECRGRFTLTRRRHHCRLCGQIFCSKCSNRQVSGAELGYSGVLRLCNFCANQVESYSSDRIHTTPADESGCPVNLSSYLVYLSTTYIVQV